MSNGVVRWFLDLAFVKNVCIGKVAQLPAGPDPVAKGAVQKQADWRAWGMAEDWCDTDLGNQFGSKEEAMAAVSSWYWDRVEGQRTRHKLPCSSHYQFRPGCVMCEAANVERKLE